MRCPSAVASGESNRHNSTLVACSEKSAKLTPFPSHVAPKGKGRPGHTLMHGSPRVGFDSLCRGGRPRVVLRIVSQTPRTIKPGEQDLYRSGFTDGVCASEWLNFRGCLDRESDSLGPVIPLENVFKRERACLRETAFAQACFDRSQFDGLLVGFSQDVLRVVPERAALQEILQLLPLLLDRLDPAIRPMVRLMLPLEEVQKQGFETAKDLSPIASCHVGQELVQVLVVQLAKSPFGYKASHHVQPGSFILVVQVAGICHGFRKPYLNWICRSQLLMIEPGPCRPLPRRWTPRQADEIKNAVPDRPASARADAPRPAARSIPSPGVRRARHQSARTLYSVRAARAGCNWRLPSWAVTPCAGRSGCRSGRIDGPRDRTRRGPMAPGRVDPRAGSSRENAHGRRSCRRVHSGPRSRMSEPCWPRRAAAIA